MLQLKLIALYDYVCRHYATHPALHFQRQTNNYCPAFTNQELMTIYLFGLIKHRMTLRDTYDYIVEHWQGWFPKLPSYQAVNYRLNQIGWQFESLIDALCQLLQSRPDLLEDGLLTDSFPVILSHRPDSARVADGLADKGYCAAKKLWYHGMKWHLLTTDRLGRLPLPRHGQFTAASVNDLSVLRQQLPALQSVAVVADKAYSDASLKAQLLLEQQVTLHTPVKKAKKADRVDAADKLYSTYVSRMRQPIESLFSWLADQVGLQDSSKIRSQKGIWLHGFGRLAAGLYILA